MLLLANGLFSTDQWSKVFSYQLRIVGDAFRQDTRV
jgi:hypothetical protein